MNKDCLGDRMKEYENIERRYLTRRMPTLIRLDGKAFHSFTKGFHKPFDMVMIESMWQTAIYLCQNIMGCKLAYTQSDEITLLLTDYDSIETQAWFGKNVQKMVSVSASMATLSFNKAFSDTIRWLDENDCGKYLDVYKRKEHTALFDSRVYNLPKEEVCNAFIWRQKDATRNAVQMMGRAHFSPKQLNKKSCSDIQDMLFQEHNIDFNALPVYLQRGACIVKEYYNKDGVERSRWVVDKNIPVFTTEEGRYYIEKYV